MYYVYTMNDFQLLLMVLKWFSDVIRTLSIPTDKLSVVVTDRADMLEIVLKFSINHLSRDDIVNLYVSVTYSADDWIITFAESTYTVSDPLSAGNFAFAFYEQYMNECGKEIRAAPRVSYIYSRKFEDYILKSRKLLSDWFRCTPHPIKSAIENFELRPSQWS